MAFSGCQVSQEFTIDKALDKCVNEGMLVIDDSYATENVKHIREIYEENKINSIMLESQLKEVM